MPVPLQMGAFEVEGYRVLRLKSGVALSRILSRAIIPLGDLLPDPSSGQLRSQSAEHAIHI
jgi:hypothetical protein